MNRKILISGSSGFIGFHTSKLLLGSNYQVIGIDSMNNYYDVNLKKLRLHNLKKFKNFKFYRDDLNNYDSLSEIFKKEKPDLVIHLAAQAGVRYSKVNPKSYIDSNLTGFSNILENIKNFNIKLIYASSSSVYGNQKNYPFKENFEPNPQSFYGLTKKFNENMADLYSNEFNLKIIGLRFFTVYGPLGRPDMAYFKFSDHIKKGYPILVYNNAMMSRDMTYVDDICEGIQKCIEYENSKHQVFNLGNNKPVQLKKLISTIENFYDKEAIIKFEKSNDEVKKTYADLTKAKKFLKYNPKTCFEDGMNNFLRWHSKFSN